MTITLILAALAVATVIALGGAAALDWVYRRGYQAGREVSAAEHYAAGHRDATDEINAQRRHEEREAFNRGYDKCLLDLGIEREDAEEVVIVIDQMERSQPALHAAAA